MGCDGNTLQFLPSRARVVSWKIRLSSSIKPEDQPPTLQLVILHHTSITYRAHLSVTATGSWQKGKWKGKQADPWPEGECKGGGEDGNAAPCAQELPGPVSAGLFPDFQGDPPFAPTAAGPQSRETEWLSLLEVEEPLSVHGALSADWDMGPDVVSLHPNICLSAQGHHCLFTVHMMCSVCVCVRVCAAAVTVCGSQGGGCGRQWYLMVGREMSLENPSNTMPLSVYRYSDEVLRINLWLSSQYLRDRSTRKTCCEMTYCESSTWNCSS